MHITIFVYGTWGDLRPHVRLGMELKKAGHEVQVVGAKTYEVWVRERGLDFYALSVDMNTFTKDNAALMDVNVFKQIQLANKIINPIVAQMALETLEATRNSDVLLTVEFGQALLFDVIAANNLKPISINPAPISLTSEFPFGSVPDVPAWFPFKGWYNRMSYRLLQRIAWSLTRGARNQLATRETGAPKAKFKDYTAMLARIPTMTTVSRHMVERPSDWPEHFQVTGFLIDDDTDWTPPKDLVDFLDAGEAPVYIGFGSMPDSKPENTTRAILDAVQASGKRAVILKGWAGLGADDVPENVFVLDYAPHSWLFPRMAAAVHHGGSGTTASALRAGLPTTIVHHAGDQVGWGKLVERLGVGTAPIGRKKLNTDNLTRAIQTLTSRPDMREKARVLGEKINQEDGLGTTLEWVKRYLN